MKKHKDIKYTHCMEEVKEKTSIGWPLFLPPPVLS